MSAEQDELSAELRSIIERVVVPALMQRLLRQTRQPEQQLHMSLVEVEPVRSTV
jgi:hypothetical protein